MLIYNKQTKKYYVSGEGFIATDRKKASIVDGIFALAICLAFDSAVTEDL